MPLLADEIRVVGVVVVAAVVPLHYLPAVRC